MGGQLRVVFCADPMNPRRVDPLYQAEMEAARDLEIRCELIDFEELVYEGDAARATRRVADAEASATAVHRGTTGIYRGWMLRPEQYGALYGALGARGVMLINDPTAYALCHHLPNWYPLLGAWTPRSTWLRIDSDVAADEIAANPPTFGSVGDVMADEIVASRRAFGSVSDGPINDPGERLADQIALALASFNRGPVIVKDFVKSQKHRWEEACFIPSAGDLDAAGRVVRRFLELQGPDLNEGLVFRAFEEFVPLATHSRSGTPLTREYRIFFVDGKPVLASEYWEEGEYDDTGPPLDQFQQIAGLVASRFFTMDVAQRRDGVWRVVELGDGQVAGLPERADAGQFYGALLGRQWEGRS